MRLLTVVALGVLVAVPALAQAPRRAGDVDSSGARCIAVIEGFELPETVVWDARRGAFLVAEIVGHPTAKDNNGRITVVSRDGVRQPAPLVAGGRADATLNGPKGMLIAGDTLWVCDVDAVRAFDRRTGAPIRTVDLAGAGAVFLNDLARHPDGSLYVTDTGLAFGAEGGPTRAQPDRVWHVSRAGEVAIALEGDSLGWVNGIAWDDRARRFVIAQLNGRDLLGWRPGERAPTRIATGPGGYDGVDVLPGGALLVSSQDGGGIYLWRTGGFTRLVSGLGSVANHAFDPRSRRVAAPVLDRNSVEIWELPARALR